MKSRAYKIGYDAGVAGKTRERGQMLVGLSCAADKDVEKRVKDWLDGFKAGEEEVVKRLEGAPSLRLEDWGHDERSSIDGIRRMRSVGMSRPRWSNGKRH